MLLLGEETEEEPREDGEEDERLLARHRDAGDLLVGLAREPPDAAVSRRSRRAGRERARAAARAGSRAGRRRRRRRRGPGREPVRRVVDDRPPEQAAGEHVRRVLGVQERVGVAQRRVVDRRDVPGEVGAEPERERGGRPGQPADDAVRAERRGEARRDARARAAPAPTPRARRSAAGASRAGGTRASAAA